MDARYVPTRHLIFFRRGRVEAVPFDPARVEITGEVVGLIPNVMQTLNTGSSYIDTGAAQLTTSRMGTLLYITGGDSPGQAPRGRLARPPWRRRGYPSGRAGTQYSAPSLSPDGRRVLYWRIGLNWSGPLWCYDLARQTSTIIPMTETKPMFPVWARTVSGYCLPPAVTNSCTSYRRMGVVFRCRWATTPPRRLQTDPGRGRPMARRSCSPQYRNKGTPSGSPR